MDALIARITEVPTDLCPIIVYPNKCSLDRRSHLVTLAHTLSRPSNALLSLALLGTFKRGITSQNMETKTD